jgi:predicted transcriptional regulator
VAAGQVVAHEDVRRWLESWGNKTALLRLAPWHRT